MPSPARVGRPPRIDRSARGGPRIAAQALHRAGVLPILVLGVVLLAACSAGGPSAGGTASEPGGTAVPASDGGGATSGAAPEPTASAGTETSEAAEAALECGTVGENQLVILVVAGPVDCAEAQEVFAQYTPGDTVNETVGSAGWTCGHEIWHAPRENDVFSNSVLCRDGERALRAAGPGTVPLPGTGVDVAEHAYVQETGTWYAFDVPGTGLTCSIRPAEEGGRGDVGCMGELPGADAVEAPGGQETPTGAVLRDADPGTSGLHLFGDPAYLPLEIGGGSFADPDDLPVGATLYAFGVVCAIPTEGTVECTAGASRMTLIPAAESYSFV